jgi:hypothetical protein
VSAVVTLPPDTHFQPPFALSLSKGWAELVEAFMPHAKGSLRQAQGGRKYRLSPNGDKAGLPSIPQGGRNSHLSPNGSLRNVIPCAVEQLK